MKAHFFAGLIATMTCIVVIGEASVAQAHPIRVCGPQPTSSTPTGRAPDTTATGIVLDTAWKVSVYEFAKKNVVHPSWGIMHSERDYQVTRKLAMAEKIDIDLDVLFAAAFLHDLGGMPGFEKKGVDHAVRSVEVAKDLLSGFGFPMQKWASVKDMILGHTYYGPLPTQAPSLAFRDADVLDFIGSIGIARIFAIVQEPGSSETTLLPEFNLLRKFRTEMPKKLSLESSKVEATLRLGQMDRFFDDLNQASFNLQAL